MKLKKLLASTLALLLIFCNTQAASAAEHKDATPSSGNALSESWNETEHTYLTRGGACDLILAQASKYRPGISAQDIMKGYSDGSLKENEPISRIELLAMLSRAFGKLPEPVGGMKILMPDAVSFGNAPIWAKKDISNIEGARILTEVPPLNENVTLSEAALLVQRIHGIIGTSLSDDYYAAANKQFIESSAIDPGYHSESIFREIERSVDADVRELVDDILLSKHGDNTPGQKITDFYNNYLNFEQRDKEGVEPIQKHINAIIGAETLNELTDAAFEICDELAVCIFAYFSVDADINVSTKKTMYFDTSGPSQNKDFYQDDDNRELFVTYLENIFKIAGLNDAFIQYAPSALYDFEKTLSEYKLDPQDYNNPDKIYNAYTFDELQAAIPNLDLKRMLSAQKYEMIDKVVVGDKALCEQFGSLFSEENLATLKALAVYELISATSMCLDTDFEKEDYLFNQKLYGIEGNKDDAQRALDAIKGMFCDYLSAMYVEKYFSEEEKADVERMCADIIAEYKLRISDLDWMSESTKVKALKKLETMILNIGYPNKYDTRAVDNALIKSFESGGSLFDNVTSVRLESREISALEQFSPVDRELWGWPVYEVNAFYHPSFNSINFPAAILRAPFYDLNEKTETNYGSIGMIIGHEISHAFDDNGAKFDENGNHSDWWTAEDYSAFEALLDKLINVYDGYEVYPGITVNGRLTLGENVADLGGLSAALSVVSKFDNPDYDAFFKSYGKSEVAVMYRDFMEFLSSNDVHSLAKARVNVPLGNLLEFYETYDVDENDFMYIAPEKRVKIW